DHGAGAFDRCGCRLGTAHPAHGSWRRSSLYIGIPGWHTLQQLRWSLGDSGLVRRSGHRLGCGRQRSDSANRQHIVRSGVRPLWLGWPYANGQGLQAAGPEPACARLLRRNPGASAWYRTATWHRTCIEGARAGISTAGAAVRRGRIGPAQRTPVAAPGRLFIDSEIPGHASGHACGLPLLWAEWTSSCRSSAFPGPANSLFFIHHGSSTGWGCPAHVRHNCLPDTTCSGCTARRNNRSDATALTLAYPVAALCRKEKPLPAWSMASWDERMDDSTLTGSTQSFP
ncbi:MAG: hypothetical protein K0S77_1180, partial [Pseudomonas sp.]|nr:hypothetical protein [Pseudomonas sp.]